MNVAEIAGKGRDEILFICFPEKTEIFKFIVFAPLRSALLYISCRHNWQKPARYFQDENVFQQKSRRKCTGQRSVYSAPGRVHN